MPKDKASQLLTCIAEVLETGKLPTLGKIPIDKDFLTCAHPLCIALEESLQGDVNAHILTMPSLPCCSKVQDTTMRAP